MKIIAFSNRGSNGGSNGDGFTMVETIIYVAIASVFLWVVLGFFWQMRLAEVKADLKRELKENVAQSVEIFRTEMRNGEDVDEDNSTFDTDTSVLSIDSSGSDHILDTYQKDITVGEENVTIRKLRYSEGVDSSDLTSDRVNVDRFRLSRFTQGAEPDVVQMNLKISTVNPGEDPLYDEDLSVRLSSNIRVEE